MLENQECLELRSLNVSELLDDCEKFEQSLTIPCKIYLNDKLIAQVDKKSDQYIDTSIDLTTDTKKYFNKLVQSIKFEFDFRSQPQNKNVFTVLQRYQDTFALGIYKV